MFFKNRCHITAVLVAGVLGISMVTGLTRGSSDGTKKWYLPQDLGKMRYFGSGTSPALSGDHDLPDHDPESI